MKIMFVFGGKQKGGAERVITNLANGLIKNNVVSFLGVKKIDNLYKYNDDISYYILDDDNVKYHSFIDRNYKRVKKMIKYMKEENPDIIVSFAGEQCYRTLFVNLFNKRKIIVSLRNDPIHEYNSFFKKLLMKILYRRANGFVFQTEDARDYFNKKIRDNSIIIPNPINEQFIVDPYKGKREKIIVNAGRLAPQKNQDLLIKAFNEFNKKVKGYKLYIYGEGELEEELRKTIDELKLNDLVILKGNVSNLKDEIYNKALFVLSSDFEGMPNALIEAMALGMPSISTDCPCGGPKYLIKNGKNGLLVPVHDVSKLAGAMEKALSSEKYANGLGIEANKIKNKLDPHKIENMWVDYINKVLNGGVKNER